MARLIESSEGITSVILDLTFKGKIRIQCLHGWKSTKYLEEDIDRLEAFDEEQFRSAGKAVAGAVIGGVLTGGIGFLAGAAIGGRRRKTGSYLVVFKDGIYVAFEEKKKRNVKLLNAILEKAEIKSMLDPAPKKDQ